MTRSPSHPARLNPIAFAQADDARDSVAGDVPESIESPPGSPFIIGVAGGTGSGKTTVSRHIQDAIPPGKIVYIQHDSYYRDQSALPPAARAHVNYDHPRTLDTALLIRHLQDLRAGKPVRVPIYDFTTHTRAADTICVLPVQVILVEGILILAEPSLRELLDMRIFVDTDADVRFIRRLRRDLCERGRTLESIIHQYEYTVRPMHLEFVEPSKRYAHVIVPEDGHNHVALEMIISRIQAVLAARGRH